ncbi:MAG TPA: dihydropteroate synthase [Afifellaceae bacterium]|nr:dihydropteroate synthase [Afifellaceae bacterium]
MPDRGAGFARLLADWSAAAEPRPALLMGVVNVTPDSFSDGGLFADADRAIGQGRRHAAEGAAIVDIGGESTRPGGEPVDEAEELRRVLPVVSALAGSDALVSIDTVKPAVAREALEAGAHIVNDVRGLQGDPALAEVAAACRAGIVAMHNPALFGSSSGTEGDAVAACIGYFGRTIDIAERAGIAADRIVLDPGLGFGKTLEQNLALIARLEELAVLGLPLLVGASRKSFLGKLLDRPVDQRLHATLAAHMAAALHGAAILRVHDVAEHVDFVRVAAALRAVAMEAAA